MSSQIFDWKQFARNSFSPFEFMQTLNLMTTELQYLTVERSNNYHFKKNLILSLKSSPDGG